MIITSLAKGKKDVKKPLDGKIESLCEMLDVNCHICTSTYNSVEHTPISICPEEHTYCSQCVSELFSQKSKATRCPTCRVFITQVATKVNKTLLRLCDLVPKAAEKIEKLEEQKRQLTQRVTKLTNELRKREQQEQEQRNKQNMNQNIEPKEEFNGFPLINPNQLINKSKKLNIHSYVARRRRFSSATSRKDADIKIDQVGLRKKVI